MQWKIARSGRLSEAFNRWAVARGLPALAWLAPRAPRAFLHANARWVIGLVMLLHRAPRPAIARNLARVLGEPAGSPRVRGAMRRMFRYFAWSWVDLFRFAQLPAERLRELVTEASLPALGRLQGLREGGRRTILLTAHLGNWELGSVLAGQAGLPVSVVYVPDAFEEAERLRSFLRRFGEVEEIPIRPQERFASLPVLRAFERGRMVALQGDRDWNDRGVAVELCGGRTTLPLGPFHLARMSGALLTPIFIAYAPDRRIEIELGEPIEVARDGDRDTEARAALASWTAVLERAIRRWPEQWYTFYDFWPERGGEAS